MGDSKTNDLHTAPARKQKDTKKHRVEKYGAEATATSIEPIPEAIYLSHIKIGLTIMMCTTAASCSNKIVRQRQRDPTNR